jgi:tRNA(fMet)-specific endonuclease VapC
MRHLLDTNTCIHYLNGADPSVVERWQGHPPEDLVICSVVRAELLYGAHKSRNTEPALAKLESFWMPYVSLPFDDTAARAYGRLRAELERAGTIIGPNDLMIASIALSQDLLVVSNNTREFERVPGLAVEDWETSA